MIEHACPNCGARLRHADDMAGLTVLCPECRGTRLQVPQTSTIAAEAKTEVPLRDWEERSTAAATPARTYQARCFFCDELTQVEENYVRVSSASFWRNFVRNLGPAFVGTLLFGAAAYSMHVNQVHVRCRCCATCRGKVNRVRWRGWLLLLICFGYPILACAGLVALKPADKPL